MGIESNVVTTTVIMWADEFMHKHERHYRNLALEVYKDMGDGVNVFRPTNQGEFVGYVQCATSEGGLLVISCHGGYFTRFEAFGFGGNVRSRIFAPISDLPDLGKLDLLVADSCYGASEGFIGELASKNLNQLIGHPGEANISNAPLLAHTVASIAKGDCPKKAFKQALQGSRLRNDLDWQVGNPARGVGGFHALRMA